jgi:hypothetical protein
MSTIHVASPSGEQSQQDESQLRRLWEQGLIPEGSHYWKEGMSEWRPISECFEPASSANIPPPVIQEPAAPAYSYSYTRDPRSLTSFLVVMLWVNLGFEIVSVLSDLAQMSLLRSEYTEAESATNDLRQGLVGLGSLAVTIVTGVAFLMWIYRANLNCRGFGALGMKFTPGWSVGYYFIPFFNLVRPYQAMKEIWKISHNPRRWETQSEGALLGTWWALWLLHGFVGQVAFRLSVRADSVDLLQTSTAVSVLTGMIGIPLCFVAIRLIRTISSGQESIVNHAQPITEVDHAGTGPDQV